MLDGIVLKINEYNTIMLKILTIMIYSRERGSTRGQIRAGLKFSGAVL